MENKTSCTIMGLLLVVILAFAGLAIWLVMTVQQTVQQAQEAIQPMVQIPQSINTQVAEIIHPTPTIIPDPVTIIHSVRTLARLETIQYSIEKVITAETNQDMFGPLFGDKLLFVAHGDVIAGIDLEKLTADDLKLEGSVLSVKLPAPEIFVIALDSEKSYVYDRQTGLFNKGEKDLESEARKAAEQLILEAALEDGILDQARQNAEVYLERLFGDLGYPNVIFSE
ncbi:MAG: DUF4230 domain-containing protein [Chloroflexota bacterium]